jgi:hypothetical protein
MQDLEHKYVMKDYIQPDLVPATVRTYKSRVIAEPPTDFLATREYVKDLLDSEVFGGILDESIDAYPPSQARLGGVNYSARVKANPAQDYLITQDYLKLLCYEGGMDSAQRTYRQRLFNEPGTVAVNYRTGDDRLVTKAFCDDNYVRMQNIFVTNRMTTGYREQVEQDQDHIITQNYAQSLIYDGGANYDSAVVKLNMDKLISKAYGDKTYASISEPKVEILIFQGLAPVPGSYLWSTETLLSPVKTN